MEPLEFFAGRFRVALENTARSQLPITFQGFPNGACGDAALLLSRYLLDQGCGSFNYVLGMRGEGGDRHSHAWLQRGEILVDITADQFPEVDQAVIVTTHSPWHAEFQTEVLHEADYRIYDFQTAAMLDTAYEAVMQSMETVV